MMARLIAAAVLVVLAGASSAWAACTNGQLPDGKGGCYYPPFANSDWYKQQQAQAARRRRACWRGQKWACPGPGPVVH